MTDWSVYALKYAERNNRKRNESFILDPHHDSPHEMDYFIWILQSQDRVIMVDCGYDDAEAKNRGRPILRAPAEALKAINLTAEDITDIVITHLHYDHAGGIDAFPNAKLYINPIEMAAATGPCMCVDAFRYPYTADHICSAIKALYSGRLIFTPDQYQLADGVMLHQIGGHAKGLQAVQVKTKAGWMCLASDASHYYENFMTKKAFPIVIDIEAMYQGYDKILNLASSPAMVIPGHDPLVTTLYPPEGQSGHAWRLDQGPVKALPTY